jgi:hypothetical protein
VLKGLFQSTLATVALMQIPAQRALLRTTPNEQRDLRSNTSTPHRARRGERPLRQQETAHSTYGGHKSVHRVLSLLET